jgi:NADH:ubiquinone oxidoreductase subunit E
VLDTISYYTHYWTHRRGRKVIMVCRSISCQLLGSEKLLSALQGELGIAEHETTPDGEYSLITEECLAACDHAPCMLVGERLHKCVRPQDVPRILADPDNDRIDAPRSDLYDGVAQPAAPPPAPATTGGAARP